MRKLRHVSLADLFLREAAADGCVRVLDCTTSENRADVLTKVLGQSRLRPKLASVNLADPVVPAVASVCHGHARSRRWQRKGVPHGANTIGTARCTHMSQGTACWKRRIAIKGQATPTGAGRRRALERIRRKSRQASRRQQE